MEKSDGQSLLTMQDGHRRPKEVYDGDEKRKNTCPRIAVIKSPLTSIFVALFFIPISTIFILCFSV